MRTRLTLGLLLTILYLLHNDFWLWWRSDTVLGGIPVGLAYHLGYCLAVSIFWAVVVRGLGSPDPTTQ